MKSVKSNGAARYNIFDAAGTLLQVFDADAGTRTDYVPGPNGALARVSRTLSADTLTYIHADHLGTGRVGTDAAGAVKWEDYHTPFGESLIHPDATDDQGDFTGHIRDSGSGLTYMQARYYDPIAGRFLSIDPMTFTASGGNPGYFNRYAYTFNDPINFIDPFGMDNYSIAMRDEDNQSNENAFQARAQATADSAEHASQASSGDDIVSAMEGMTDVDQVNIFGHGTPDGVIGEGQNWEGLYTSFDSNHSPDAGYVSNIVDGVSDGSISLNQNAEINIFSCNGDNLARQLSSGLNNIGRGDVSVMGANGQVAPVIRNGQETGAIAGLRHQRFNTYSGGQLTTSERSVTW